MHLPYNHVKPYPDAQMRDSEYRIYNGRHNRARRTVENVFGVMSIVLLVFRVANVV
ncbi:hypothetical protein WH47_07213 [Habropoda laboriosa]|uniref:DDE Tnp4 domain-containing protein n=1 Tax=Habropoda laboriosa TaxID=597456 RepID=A0A0L7RJQ6_9HYME|nr:hypothetical protein WH47_07213 [Habropoda laboriosa]